MVFRFLTPDKPERPVRGSPCTGRGSSFRTLACSSTARPCRGGVLHAGLIASGPKLVRTQRSNGGLPPPADDRHRRHSGGLATARRPCDQTAYCMDASCRRCLMKFFASLAVGPEAEGLHPRNERGIFRPRIGVGSDHLIGGTRPISARSRWQWQRQHITRWCQDASHLWTFGFADSRMTAQALLYGPAGENALRFPHFPHRAAPAHKPPSAAATARIEFNSGKSEIFNPLPALAWSSRWGNSGCGDC